MIKHEDGRNEANDVIKMLRSIQPDMLVGVEEAETNYKDGVLTVRVSKRHTVANVIECIERLTEKLEKANGMLEWAHKEVLRLNIENSELHAELATAERERDALIKHVEGKCHACKHADGFPNEGLCGSCKHTFHAKRESAENWQWRGVFEENAKER